MMLKVKIEKFEDKVIPRFNLFRACNRWENDRRFNVDDENRTIIKKLVKYQQLMMF